MSTPATLLASRHNLLVHNRRPGVFAAAEYRQKNITSIPMPPLASSPDMSPRGELSALVEGVHPERVENRAPLGALSPAHACCIPFSYSARGISTVLTQGTKVVHCHLYQPIRQRNQHQLSSVSFDEHLEGYLSPKRGATLWNSPDTFYRKASQTSFVHEIGQLHTSDLVPLPTRWSRNVCLHLTVYQ